MFAGCLLILGVVGVWNVLTLHEAFGSGSPYYSRKTNMDKWTDPRPTLLVVDIGVLALVGAGMYWVRRNACPAAAERQNWCRSPQVLN
ncbi:hypothetical protein FNF07_28540 [Trinickia caryophylli]|nr:hypothetical protein C0Z17_07875 [Trinickia caryophylli]TRX15461.1 hypothetical protein FNF07_28540 [Trinickia caryophylli]